MKKNFIIFYIVTVYCMFLAVNESVLSCEECDSDLIMMNETLSDGTKYAESDSSLHARSSSFEVTEIIFTNKSPKSDCQLPESETYFTDVDLGVTAWVDYVNFEGGKTYRIEWYSPDNSLVQLNTNTLSNNSNGCSWRCMPREKLREYGTGEWTVKFYYDGQLYRENSFIFTVTNPSHMEKIYAVPDYSQTDTVYGGIPGGENYCGPVSVSNSLMWLDDNGFDNLAPNTDDRKKDQFDMIINLGFNYMNTDDDGTGVDELMAGAKKYLSDSGYNNFQLQYQGWRYNSSEFATGIDIPNLEWIKNGTEDTTGSVWLNVGWYIYDENTDEYNRTGGHWVTLVGYGYNGNPDYLILHDPSTCFANDFVLPVQIINGNLTGNYKGLPRSATGFYEMDNMRSDKLAILDGAVILKMNPVTILPDWVNISGNITTSDGTPLCAMVLANGQYMFSCSPAGRYSLYVPADDNGQITLFAFCDGLPPFKQIITPYQKTVISDIKMGTGTGFPMVITTQSDKNGAKPGWIKIWGTVTYNGTPLCAMILANGQHMFSCGDNQGKYELEVPLDADGQITLFGFCEGLQPFKKVFNP